MLFWSLAASTRSTYAAGWKHWIRMCLVLKFDALVGSEMALCFFVAYLSLSGSIKAWSTIHTHLYAVRSKFIEFGLPDPLKGKPLFDRVVMGAKKMMKGGDKRTRRPVTLALLRRLRACFDFASRAQRTFWNIMVICVFGLLRLGEATVKPTDPTFPTWGHVTFHKNGTVSLFLPKTKTDHVGRGCTIWFAPSGADICPVACFRSLRQDFPDAGPDAPLFPSESGLPLTGKAVIDRLHAAVGALNDPNLRPNEVNGHSFRKGGAQTLLDAGFDYATIKLMGRWSSWCVELYTGLSLGTLRSVSVAMGACPASDIL